MAADATIRVDPQQQDDPRLPEEVIKDATALIAQLDSNSLSMDLFSEKELNLLADREANSLVNNPSGAIALTTSGMTPEMQRLVDRMLEQNRQDDLNLSRTASDVDQSYRRVSDQCVALKNSKPRELAANFAKRQTEEQQKLSDTPRYQNLRAQIDGLQANYDRLINYNKGRAPVQRRTSFYLITLLLFGSLEWFANFETFERKLTPLFAYLATALVAVLVAWASHTHGQYFKQWRFLFDLEPELIERKKNWLTLWLATIALVAALAFVFYFRYRFLVETYPDPNAEIMMRFVMPVMGINIGTWFVGGIYAWWWHERVPDLREDDARRQAAQKEKRAMELRRDQEIDRIKKIYENDLAANTVALEKATRLRDGFLTVMESVDSARQRKSDADRKARSKVLRDYALRLGDTVEKKLGDASAVGFRFEGRVMSLDEFRARDFR
jgi:hypothetical protein